MTAQPWIRRRVGGVGRFDVGTAVLVALLGQQSVWAPVAGLSGVHRVGPAPAVALALLLSSVALVWRRRAPLAVTAAVSVILGSEYLIFGASDGLAFLLPQMLALYAAGRYGKAHTFASATAVTAVALAIHEWRDPQFSFAGPTYMFWAVLLGSGLVGRAFNTTARDLQEMSLRTRQLEDEREERARAVVTAERMRIARELHDLVGHGISLIVLQLVAAQANLEGGQIEVGRERLNRIEATARITLAEMRRLVSVMDDEVPSVSPQPGVREIAVLVEQVRDSGIPVNVEMTGAVDTPPGVGLAVYRVVQEALTNVIKHAGSTAGARVVIAVAAETLTVEVADWGVGPIGDLSGGRGLAGMRERVALYGGTLQLGPGPEGGFSVRACFPLEAGAA